MALTGFTGMSFPMRITPQGGVAVSTTGIDDSTHIEESIIQALHTYRGERCMESEVYSELDELLYSPNDLTLQKLASEMIIDCLGRLDDRIQVEEGDIKFNVVDEDFGSTLYATITYKVIKYETSYTTTVRIGEIDE